MTYYSRFFRAERCGFGTKAGEACGFDVLVWSDMLNSTCWMGFVNDDVVNGPDLSE
jgi:hypothetical protein